MADLLKNIYNRESIQNLANDIHQVYKDFQVENFINSVIDETWSSLEFKARIQQIALCLRRYLPEEYSQAIEIMNKVTMNYGDWLNGFVGFFPTFVEIYGLEEINWDVSMKALANFTQYASAEFAVRSFIVLNQDRMMKQMIEWSKDQSEHIRRLSCEGCRPLLPWGQVLVSLKNDPTPILPILEQLKNDPVLFVRKSVANNLNDISKNHPNLVVEIAKKWYGENENCNWIVKHGCRTLLKSGNREILELFGYDRKNCIKIANLTVDRDVIAMGEDLNISFSLSTSEDAKVRLEYGVDYVKANGKRNRKIYKISECLLKQTSRKDYVKRHSFADVSVRKHYAGVHSITLIVNGEEVGTVNFELKA